MWAHPRGSRAWLAECGLGVAVALVLFQTMSWQVPVWHVRAGLAALCLLPLLILGHPKPRTAPDGQLEPGCGGSPAVHLVGTITGIALTVLFFSGPAIAAMHAAGLAAPREVVAWHARMGHAALVLIPLHLVAAFAVRRRRWSARGPLGRAPRFRGHWLVPAAALATVLAAALARALVSI